jgi:hypothetical protein
VSFFEGLSKPHFGGIPIHVSPYVPEGEVWLFQPGEKVTVLCHEGPQAGEEIEVWLKKATMMRVFPFPMSAPLEIPRVELKVEFTL